MPVTNYYTVDGQMLGYKTAAGRKDFLTDALGSVTAEIDQTGATKTFDGRYKPFGGDLSSTGTKGSYGWVGTWGYRETGLSASSHYVRMRHYSKTSGTWTTADPIWPTEGAHLFVNGRTTFKIDHSGLQGLKDIGKDCGMDFCAIFKSLQPPSQLYKDIVKCMGEQGFKEPGDQDRIKRAITNMLSACNPTKDKPGPCIFVIYGFDIVPRPPDSCQGFRDQNGNTPCNGGNLVTGEVRGGGSIRLIPIGDGITQPRGENPQKCASPFLCGEVLKARGCNCMTVICKGNLSKGQNCNETVFHELVHCAGYGGNDSHNTNPDKSDFVYNLGNCICQKISKSPKTECGSVLPRPRKQ